MKTRSEIIDELAIILKDIRTPLELHDILILKRVKLNSKEEASILDNVPWDAVSYYHFRNLSYDLMREFQDRLDWNTISRYQKLSETFIAELQTKVNWDIISVHQKLSETFIKRFQNKISWTFIFASQDLSDVFIEKYGNKAYWDLVPSLKDYRAKNK